MEDGSRKKVISISLGGRTAGSTPSIEIHRSAGGGFEVREVQAKPPRIEMPRRDPRTLSSFHRLEPVSLNYQSPWQRLLLPHAPAPMPVQRTIDPQSIHIQKPQARTIQIQRLDSSGSTSSPVSTPTELLSQPQLSRPSDVEVHQVGPRRIEIQRIDSTGSPVHSPEIRLNQQSPLVSSSNILSSSGAGGRTITIQRGDSRSDSPTTQQQQQQQQQRSGSPTGASNVRRIEIQRVESPLARPDQRSQSPLSPMSPGTSDNPLQYPRRIEIQRTESPLARSDSPPQRSGSSSPTVEIHKVGPHTLEIKRGGGAAPRMLEIQRENSSSSSGASSPTMMSRVIEIQRSDSPSASPPGSPRIIGDPSTSSMITSSSSTSRVIPIQRLGAADSSAAPRPSPQGAETRMTQQPEVISRPMPGPGTSRILPIQRTDQPHQMQVHRIEPPHLEIQRSEPVIRQGPMDVRWPSSRRVEIRGILGRGLQRNRTLSFTIRGGRIEMGGLEGGKIFSLRAPKEDVAIIEREVKPALPRGEPDGEAASFLKQKEAQLREKRERERERELEREREQQREKEQKREKELQQQQQQQRQQQNDERQRQQEQQRQQQQQEQQQEQLARERERERERKEREAQAEREREAQKQKTIEANKPSKKKDVEPPPPEPARVKEPEPKTVAEKPAEKQKPKQKETVPTPAVTAPAKPEPAPKPEIKLKKPAVQKDTSANIPQFYFPLGKPCTADDDEAKVQKVKDIFAKLDGGKAQKENFGAICKALVLPVCWGPGLYVQCGGEKSGQVTLQSFLAMWRKLCSTCHDDAAKFVRLFAKQGCNYMVAEDFVPIVQDIVDSHPGLSFLQDAPEFHSRYVHTVISRIFYCVNRSWSGRISVHELRRSNFLQTLVLLEEEDDINQISDYFSYEHFYVIYCKFWELDKDHDLFISKEDLSKHNDHAISSRMIDRIFSGAVTRGRAQKEGKMSYTEFVWFLISEEDKRHPTSIEYWFRCMDLDGDGVISMYEMEYFYEEQVQRMEALGIETLPYEDCLCQMLDMVKPREDGRVALADLKACKMCPIFFDTFFNLEKYLEHEQKDPFANVRDGDEPELSDWERYAAEEYEILVAEEGATEGHQEEVMYEDDFEPDEDEPVSGRQDPSLNESKNKTRTSGGSNRAGSPEDDIYDFSTKDLGY